MLRVSTALSILVFCCILPSLHFQSPLPEESSAGFLADVIPLEIVTTTPTALTRDESVSVVGQQAITVSESQVGCITGFLLTRQFSVDLLLHLDLILDLKNFHQSWSNINN